MRESDCYKAILCHNAVQIKKLLSAWVMQSLHADQVNVWDVPIRANGTIPGVTNAHRQSNCTVIHLLPYTILSFNKKHTHTHTYTHLYISGTCTQTSQIPQIGK